MANSSESGSSSAAENVPPVSVMAKLTVAAGDGGKGSKRASYKNINLQQFVSEIICFVLLYVFVSNKLKFVSDKLRLCTKQAIILERMLVLADPIVV